MSTLALIEADHAPYRPTALYAAEAGGTIGEAGPRA